MHAIGFRRSFTQLILTFSALLLLSGCYVAVPVDRDYGYDDRRYGGIFDDRYRRYDRDRHRDRRYDHRGYDNRRHDYGWHGEPSKKDRKHRGRRDDRRDHHHHDRYDEDRYQSDGKDKRRHKPHHVDRGGKKPDKVARGDVGGGWIANDRKQNKKKKKKQRDYVGRDQVGGGWIADEGKKKKKPSKKKRSEVSSKKANNKKVDAGRGKHGGKKKNDRCDDIRDFSKKKCGGWRG